MKYQQVPYVMMKIAGFAAMADMFETTAMVADIDNLRKLYPKLKTMETFLREGGWDKKELKNSSSCLII